MRGQAAVPDGVAVVRHTWDWDRKGFEATLGPDTWAASLGPADPAADGDDLDLTCEVSHGGGRFTVYGTGRFREALAAGGPALAPALAALDGLLPDGAAAVVASMPAELFDSAATERFYLGMRGGGSARIGAALAHPSLAFVLPEIADWGSWHRGPSVRDILARRHPEASATTLSRILRLPFLVPDTRTLSALAGIPHDWVPDDRDEWEAFCLLATAAESLVPHLRGHSHLLASRGRWAAFADALVPRESHFRAQLLQRRCRDVDDMVTAFAREVVGPAVHAASPGTDRLDASHSLRDFVAARILLGRKSLPAILELSERWHRDLPALRARMDRVRADHPLVGNGPAMSWPVPFPPALLPGGVEVRFLSTEDELMAEGHHGSLDGAAGLRHCVGTYREACASGRACIASVRLLRPDGFTRLSTAQVAFDRGRFGVVQHRGARNGNPPRVAAEAMSLFMAEVDSGRLAPLPAWTDPSWRREEHVRDGQGCGYDRDSPGAVEAAVAAWSPFLTRPARDAGALAAMALDDLRGWGTRRPVAMPDREPVPGPRRRASPWRDIPLAVASWLACLPLAASGKAFEALSRAPFAVAATGAVAAFLATEGTMLANAAFIGDSWGWAAALALAQAPFAMAEIRERGFVPALRRTLGNWSRARRLNATTR